MLRGCDPSQTFELKPEDGAGIVLHCRYLRVMQRHTLGDAVDAFIQAETEAEIRRTLGEALSLVFVAAENVPGHPGRCSPEVLIDLLTSFQVTDWISQAIAEQRVSEAMLGKSGSARPGAAAPSAGSVAPGGA